MCEKRREIAIDATLGIMGEINYQHYVGSITRVTEITPKTVVNTHKKRAHTLARRETSFYYTRENNEDAAGRRQKYGG